MPNDMRGWFRSAELFGTSALALAVDEFGPDCVEWDPATMYMELQHLLGSAPSQGLEDRLQAASSLFTTDNFFSRLEVFTAICNALNWSTVSSQLWLPAELDDVLWGCTEAHLLLGSEFKPELFDPNIALYVGTLLRQTGLHQIPQILSWAQMPDHGTPNGFEALSTDAVMFKAHWDAQQQDKAALEGDNHRRLLALLKQLSLLPLRNGDVGWLQERLAGKAA